MYAHGYGVGQNIETTLDLYNRVGTDEAQRNKLALLIAANKDGAYDEEILSMIHWFIEKDDYIVKNYVSLCLYDHTFYERDEGETLFVESVDAFHRTQSIVIYVPSLSVLGNNVYEWYVLQGASAGYNQDGNAGIYYRYLVYHYMYLDDLERLYY